VSGVTAVANAGEGVVQGTVRSRGRLLDSTVIGNASSGAGLADIAWAGRLRIAGTTYGKAAKFRSTGPDNDYRWVVVRRRSCPGG
jgi:hypothetical protein